MPMVNHHIALLIIILASWITTASGLQAQDRKKDVWVPFDVNQSVDAFWENMRTMTKNRRKMTTEEMSEIRLRLKDLHQSNPSAYDKYAHLIHVMLTDPPKTGLYFEFGVFSGLSANITARLMKKGLELHGFDSFKGLPQNWTGHAKRGAFGNGGRIPAVEPNVKIYKGFFNATLPVFLSDHKHRHLGFANMDADIYSSTREVLHMLNTRMHRGSILHFHEFFVGNVTQTEELRALHDFAINEKPTVRFQMLNVTAPFTEPVVLRIAAV